MKNTIVPEILAVNGIEFFDENDTNIKICEDSEIIYHHQNVTPFILVDNFNLNKSKTPDIKRIELNALEKFNYRLVSVKVIGSMNKYKTYRNQQKVYVLEQKGNTIPKSDIVGRIPTDHYIEYDLENKQIRIKGKNSFPYIRSENASEWVPVIDKK